MLLAFLALVALVFVIGVKYHTTIQIQKFKQKVVEAETALRKSRGDLAMADNGKAAAEISLREEKGRKSTLERQIQKYDQELQSLRK